MQTITTNEVPSLQREWDDDAFSAMMADVTARMRKTPRELMVENVIDHLTVGLGIMETTENDE